MAHRGQTKKPCEGCGDDGGRPVGALCRQCRKLLDEAQTLRKDQKERKNTVIRKHHRTTHWNPSYYGADCGHDAREEMQAAMTDLIFAVSEPWINDGSSKGFDVQGLIQRSDYRRSSNYDSLYDAPILAVLADIVAALNRLDRAILAAQSTSYRFGFYNGSSLLAQLAHGTTTIDNFDEECARGMKPHPAESPDDACMLNYHTRRKDVIEKEDEDAEEDEENDE